MTTPTAPDHPTTPLELAAGPSFALPTGAPRLGLGLAALGRPGYINAGREIDLGPAGERTIASLRDRAYEVLDAAWESGVRYFDCARSYGRSEEFLSGWLEARGHNAPEVCVGSKWGYRYTADWRVDTCGAPHEVKDHALEHLETQLQESAEWLGDHIQLYQIHSATLDSGVLDNAAVLDRLARLRAEHGWHIGLSLSGVRQAETLEKALQTGLFDAVQATWNVLEQSAGPALLRAHEAGLQVIVKEAMANGRVLQQPALVSAAKDFDTTPDALALAIALIQPFQPLVLSGAVTATQVQSNFAALELAGKLQDDDPVLLDTLLQQLRADPTDYWRDRSQLPWT